MCDERLPMSGLESETPPRIFIVVIDNNDSWTFRPVAMMAVGKLETSASGSFRISNQY